jgi:D-alanyl-D-alanine carboxypeptidase/D-alanyl-D-alanine-endopeptidase (penicillin-binding protein 4)
MPRFVFVIIVFLSAINVSFAREIDSTIKNLVKKTGINKQNIGIVIQDLKSGKKIYSLNDDKYFSIASVNKLFLTAAALKYLGNDYRFITTISGSLPDEQGLVKGDLFIKGGGDPLFVSESMWFLVNKLVNLGVKNIEGDIILDDSEFPSENVYEESNSDRAYSARISALSVNFNSIALNLISGSRPRFVLDPDVESIKLDTSSIKNDKRTNINLSMKGNKLFVSGLVNDKAVYDYQTWYRNVSDTKKYFAEVLGLHLKWRGINVLGSIKSGKNNKDSLKLFDVESRRLSDIITEMNKFSSNFIAEQLLRAIAKKQFGDASEVQKSIALINDYLVGLGIDKEGLNIVNGSGFSKKNISKPSELSKFLSKIYASFDVSPEFIASLSIAGIDGTVKKTNKSDFMYGRVRAKTGTLSGVRALAGYFSYKDNNYCFFIVVNDQNAYKMIDWEGRILESALSI